MLNKLLFEKVSLKSIFSKLATIVLISAGLSGVATPANAVAAEFTGSNYHGDSYNTTVILDTNSDTNVTIYGTNLQSCHHLYAMGGGWNGDIPVTPAPDGLSATFVFNDWAGKASQMYGWALFDCGNPGNFFSQGYLVFPVWEPARTISATSESPGGLMTIEFSGFDAFFDVTSVKYDGVSATSWTRVSSKKLTFTVPDGVTNATKCIKVTNFIGESEYCPTSITPIVAAPGTPGTPSVTRGDGQVTVTPVAPSTGGTPTSYTVTSSPGGFTCTITLPDTSCDVTGLTNGTAYTFTVTATNGGGTSGSSSASSSVTPTSLISTTSVISTNHASIYQHQSVSLTSTITAASGSDDPSGTTAWYFCRDGSSMPAHCNPGEGTALSGFGAHTVSTGTTGDHVSTALVDGIYPIGSGYYLFRAEYSGDSTYASSWDTVEVQVDATPTPSISGITPTHGSIYGGTQIVISGSHFTMTLLPTITVGGVACTDVNTPYGEDPAGSGMATTVTCYTGEHAAGLVDVVVTNPNNASSTWVESFTYEAVSASASSSSISRGESFTLTTNAPGTFLAAFFVDGVIPDGEMYGNVSDTPNPINWSDFGGCTNRTFTYRVFPYGTSAPPLWTDTYLASIEITLVGDSSACSSGGSSGVDNGLVPFGVNGDGLTRIIFGKKLSDITAIKLGNKSLVFKLLADGTIQIELPADLVAGNYDLELVTVGTSVQWKNALHIRKTFTKPVSTNTAVKSIAGFAGNSAVLTNAQKLAIKNVVSGAKQLICTGSTSNSKVTAADKKLALNRAKAACAYAKKLLPSLITKVSAKPSIAVGAKARKVVLTITK